MPASWSKAAWARSGEHGRAARANNIHDDATAQNLGFRGGTIAGSIHLDQFPPVLMAAFSGGDTGVDWGGMTASGVLVILPVIIFSFLAQRHLVAGLSSGAVKG